MKTRSCSLSTPRNLTSRCCSNVAGPPYRLVELPKLPRVTDPHFSRLRLDHKPVAVGAEAAIDHIDRVMDFHGDLLNRLRSGQKAAVRVVSQRSRSRRVGGLRLVLPQLAPDRDAGKETDVQTNKGHQEPKKCQAGRL